MVRLQRNTLDLIDKNPLAYATRVFLLSQREDRMILSSFVWIGVPACDGQTDGIAVAKTALCIASNAAAL